ncbi:MAG: hypothetical protein QXL15_02465 [Candidatus Korarchaeota archaeon]
MRIPSWFKEFLLVLLGIFVWLDSWLMVFYIDVGYFWSQNLFKHIQWGFPLILLVVVATTRSMKKGIIRGFLLIGLYLLGLYRYVYKAIDFPEGLEGLAILHATVWLLVILLAALVLSYIGAMDYMRSSLEEQLHNPKFIVSYALAVLAAYYFGPRLLSLTEDIYKSPSTLFLTSLVIIPFIVGIVALLAHNFWAGFFTGFTLTAIYYTFSITWEHPYLTTFGLFSFPYLWAMQVNMHPYGAPGYISYTPVFEWYISMWAFMIVASLWSGLMGMLSNFFTKTKETSSKVDFTRIYRFREMWSQYFLLGKNTVPEYEKLPIPGVFSKILSALHLKKLLLHKHYRYMDRRKPYEKRPIPDPELDVKKSDSDMVTVIDRNSGQVIGTFKDPEDLYYRWKPVWNPLVLYSSSQISLAISWPVLIISMTIGSYYIFSTLLNDYVMAESLGKSMEYLPYVVIGILLYAVIFVFLIFWKSRLDEALEEHSEGSTAFIVVAVIAIVALLFASRTIHRTGLAIVLLEDNPEVALSVLRIYATDSVIYLFVVSFVLSFATVQVLGAENFNMYFYDHETSLRPKDRPFWLKTRYYYVFRFLFWWPYEFTVGSHGLAHEDWERIEIWIQASTGKPEWIVSDYHWRALWYRVPDLDEPFHIMVDFKTNFHTPEVFVLRDSVIKEYQKLSPVRVLARIIKESISKSWKRSKEFLELESKMLVKKEELLPKDKRAKTLVDIFLDIPPPVNVLTANTIADFPWTFIMYPEGVATALIDKKNKVLKYIYREKGYVLPPDIAAEGGTGINLMANKNDGFGKSAVDFQKCFKCGAPLKGPICDKCHLDMRDVWLIKIR